METTLLVSIISQVLATVAGLMASFLKVKGKRGVTVWGGALVIFQLAAAGLFVYHQSLTTKEEQASAKTAAAQAEAREAWESNLRSPIRNYGLQLSLRPELADAFMRGKCACEWTFLDTEQSGICLSQVKMHASEDGKRVVGRATVYRQVRTQSEVEPYETFCPRLDPSKENQIVSAVGYLYPAFTEKKEGFDDNATYVAKLATKTSFAKSESEVQGEVDPNQDVTLLNLSVRCSDFNLIPEVETLADFAGVNTCQFFVTGPAKALISDFDTAALTVSLTDGDHPCSLLLWRENLLFNDPSVGDMLQQAFVDGVPDTQRDAAIEKAVGVIDAEGLTCLVDCEKLLASWRSEFYKESVAVPTGQATNLGNSRVVLSLNKDLLAETDEGALIAMWSVATFVVDHWD